MDYREILKNERKKQNISQAKIADVLKTTQQQINKYDNQQQEMTATKLFEYAKALNISLDYIAGRTDNPKGGIK